MSAYNDGTGWVVETSAGRQPAGLFETALRLARNEIGHFLRRARRDQPWGLVVQAGGSSAIYGTPNPAAGVVLGGPPPAIRTARWPASAAAGTTATARLAR